MLLLADYCALCLIAFIGKICLRCIQKAPSWSTVDVSSWKDEDGKKDGGILTVL